MSGLDFPEPLPAQPPTDPAKPKPKGRPDSAPRPTPARRSSLKGRLHESISGIGVMVALVNEVDGLAILDGSERLAESLDKAAQQNPRVKRALEAALTGGVWAEVTFAVGAIALPIALNHGIIPPSLGGFVSSPEPTTPKPSGDGEPIPFPTVN